VGQFGVWTRSGRFDSGILLRTNKKWRVRLVDQDGRFWIGKQGIVAPTRYFFVQFKDNTKNFKKLQKTSKIRPQQNKMIKMLDRSSKNTYLYDMNKLPIAKRVQLINLLVEGSSLRATSRIADVSINTVTKLLIEVGKACEKFHDETVQGVKSQRIQCDEIWSFVYSKQKNVPTGMEDEAGDVWTWTCIDADTKLIVSWYVGNRDAQAANEFMMDVATRIKGKPEQITTDGLHEYLKAVMDAFGSQVNFAQLIKQYNACGDAHSTEKKYSPSECIGTKKNIIFGQPDREHISTSYVERANLTMRMHMRRFTRLTNGFSKKIENHAYAVALHFVYYNFVKQHKTLRITPAMAAGLTKRFMSFEDIVNLTETTKIQKISN
jgi:IS1 family transposase